MHIVYSEASIQQFAALADLQYVQLICIKRNNGDTNQIITYLSRTNIANVIQGDW